ncbi:MAG: TRAP transporter substrate-binding protein [Desulfobacterales bacterium]|nr:TRAP transporter substrate-binding protein [Desulfobacterales bacterium]
MKQKNLFVLAAMFLAVMFFATGPVMARPIELSLGLITPPTHLRNINVIKPWMKMIEEKTQGKVKVTPYYAGALAPPPESFNSIVSGIADMGEGIAYATPGQFPLTEIVMLPELGLKSGQAASAALWHAFKKFPELAAEYAGVKVLWLHVNPPLRLITRNKPVRSLEDLKGMKIRVSGASSAKMGKALGFTPVSMGIGDLYLALEKGVLDGVIIGSDVLISRRIAEVSKYVTDMDLGHDTFFVVINNDTWDRLPKDVQTVMDSLSGDWAVDFTAKAWDKFDVEAKEKAMAQGIEFITLSPEEKARWKKLLSPIKATYAAEQDQKGLPGTEILNDLQGFQSK